MKKVSARVVLLALLLCGAAQAEVAGPPLTRRVTDLTATLDAQQTQTLESRLAAFEAKKGAQLAVLIVPTTQPEAIEQFGIRVVEAWKLGRKGVDDGALLLVAKDDRALRIEVGYGLEGALNDATAHRIVDEIIVPRFKRGEFYRGIESGITAMMQVIDGEPLPPPRRAAASGTYDIESLLFIAFGLVVVVGGMLRALLGRFPAALLMGGALGVLAWLTVAPLLIAVLAGVAAFVFVLLGGGGRGFGGGGFGGTRGGGFGGGGGFSGGAAGLAGAALRGDGDMKASMDIKRLMRHLSTGNAALRRAFPSRALDAVSGRYAKQNCIADNPFSVEAALDIAPLLAGQSAQERAVEVFSRLRVWDAEQQRCWLLLLADRDVEIVADRGVHAAWQHV